RAWFENRVFNEQVEEAAVSGPIRLSLPGARAVHRTIEGLEQSLDWIGLNYYTRWMVRMFGRDVHVARRGAPRTDNGWEIWPPGLADAATRIARLGVPVLVTEHGFADRADAFRPRALIESLVHLQRAITAGTNVIGYLHWSLVDNFE